MDLLRYLFFIQACFEFEIEAVRVPGAFNRWANAISRKHVHVFLLQVPGAVGNQCQVSLQLILDLQPG